MSDEIPTPDERLGADVVVYDGLCPLCTATVRQLAEWDRRRRLAFLPLQDPEVMRRWLYGLISHGRYLLGRRETCPQGTCPMHRGGS